MTDNNGHIPRNNEELLRLMEKEDENRPTSSGTKFTTNDVSSERMPYYTTRRVQKYFEVVYERP